MVTAASFEVIQHNDDAPDVNLGVVTLDEAGKLAIVMHSADTGEQLETIVEELNAEDTLHQDAPPPAGACPFEVFTRPVPRGAPEFVQALHDHLRRYFDIELRLK